MSVCVKTLYHVFPEIKALGCCHEVFGTQNLLLEIYKKYGGCQDAVRRDININVMGINHFTWLDRAQCLGTDLFPLYEDVYKRQFMHCISIRK